MSTFMEHIHRDTDTPPSFDGAARSRPVEHDLASSDDRGRAGLVDGRMNSLAVERPDG